ncbi:MAG: MlaD family protein [Ignavibacteria bacterium]|jgi:phospholipid/cholesterol/gamma-HCH transport system substrate-binding protein|nr:MlaD family protein [Ignavibacteria bacterium]MDH7528141.1 MlaD family protein [Ignavibacteria bacterium]
MKENRKTNIKVGITVLIGIFIFLFILGWAKRITIAGDYNVLKMRFNSVSGLELGDHITINGVKMGKVHNIIIEGNSVIVEGYIPKNVILKQDAKATVEMMDLMGGKKIEIKPGESNVPFDFNNILEGKLSTDIPGALAMVGNVEQDLKLIILDTKILLEKINDHLSDENTMNSLKTSVKNLEEITTNLNNFLVKNNSKIEKTIENISNLTEKSDRFLSENADTLIETFKETRELIANLNNVVNSLEVIMKQTQSRENNIGKILYDEELYDKLKQSIIKLDTISNLLLEQLEAKGIKVDAKIRLFK